MVSVSSLMVSHGKLHTNSNERKEINKLLQLWDYRQSCGLRNRSEFHLLNSSSRNIYMQGFSSGALSTGRFNGICCAIDSHKSDLFVALVNADKEIPREFKYCYPGKHFVEIEIKACKRVWWSRTGAVWRYSAMNFTNYWLAITWRCLHLVVGEIREL